MQIDTRFPLNKLNALAKMESYNKHYYRPPNYLHKWWARRLDLETIIEPEQAAVDVEHARQFVARVRQYLQQEGWL